MERIVFSLIITYIEDNNLADEFQSIYRSHFSTETDVINVSNDILILKDNVNPIQVLLKDLSALFDMLDHDILKIRLINIGICGIALD